MEEEKKKVFTTNAMLLALLEDMCKKTGKVSKEDFIDEAVDLLSEEFSNEGSARNAILQHHLKEIIDDGDVKIGYENGKEMLYLVKRHHLTIAKVVPYKGLVALSALSFILFAFSIFWTIITKDWVMIVVCSIMLFATLIVSVTYERNLTIIGGKSPKHSS
jgi:hypothetical protein